MSRAASEALGGAAGGVGGGAYGTGGRAVAYVYAPPITGPYLLPPPPTRLRDDLQRMIADSPLPSRARIQTMNEGYVIILRGTVGSEYERDSPRRWPG